MTLILSTGDVILETGKSCASFNAYSASGEWAYGTVLFKKEHPSYTSIEFSGVIYDGNYNSLAVSSMRSDGFTYKIKLGAADADCAGFDWAVIQ